MKNTIDATVDYSFKGEAYHLSTTIDLDETMRLDGQLPNIYLLLARVHNLDTYSYQYDAMESHSIIFSNATGFAAECLVNGEFDADRFKQLWQERDVLQELQHIAREHLKIEDLEQNPDIKKALRMAYETGKHHNS